MNESLDLKKLKEHLKQVKIFADRVSNVSIEIEDRDPKYVYLMHATSVLDSDIYDIYKNGLSYSENELWRTFNNLSREWQGKSIFKEQADQTSMEHVIVESCKKMYFQCFIYKIPLCFFETIGSDYFPIPIWTIDDSYCYKTNPSSTGISCEKNTHFFRMSPKLLLGHYDLRTNQFYRNENYSTNVINYNGVYDKQQLFFLSSSSKYSDLWKHNQFVLNGEDSPYSVIIEEITKAYQESLSLENNQK